MSRYEYRVRWPCWLFRLTTQTMANMPRLAVSSRGDVARSCRLPARILLALLAKVGADAGQLRITHTVASIVQPAAHRLYGQLMRRVGRGLRYAVWPCWARDRQPYGAGPSRRHADDVTSGSKCS